jgi:hypothetical protein
MYSFTRLYWISFKYAILKRESNSPSKYGVLDCRDNNGDGNRVDVKVISLHQHSNVSLLPDGG